MKVVQERLERANVENTQTCPVHATDARKHREYRGLSLAACRWSEQQAVRPRRDRLDAFFLQGAQFAPPQRVYDVVLNKRIELVESFQSSKEISSTDLAAIEFRSSALSSSSRMVRR